MSIDYIEELKNVDRERLLFGKQMEVESNNLIYQLKNTDLGQRIKSEILIPKKLKKDRFYKIKQSINKFFNLFG